MASQSASDLLSAGLKTARTVLRISARAAGQATMQVIETVQARRRASAAHASAPPTAPPRPAPTPSRPTPAPPRATPTPSRPAPTPAATTAPSRPAPTAPDPAAASPAGSLADRPSTPLTREAGDAKTVEDADEIVDSSAEPGAEDGAGAQVDFSAPWAGYDGDNVAAVTARLADADAAAVAVIELYEQTHKARKGVLDAAAKRLRSLGG